MTTSAPPATRTIEVFRPGTHVTMGGESIAFSADDLRSLAASYDAEAAPAPIVIGHPAIDAPAFGWARSFSFDDQRQRLTAEVERIEPSFAEAVQAGRYRKVSLSFFRPGDPANPAPGKWYPRHVGFLGAAAPAVTGLKVVSFASAKDPVTVEFAAGARETASLLRKLREFLIEKFSIEEADKALPDWEIRWLEEADQPAATSPAPAYANPPPEDPNMTTPTIPPADFAARQTALDERERQLADRERGIVHDGNVAFAAELVAAGRVLPAQEARLVAVLDAITSGAVAPVSFAAGETAVSPAEHLKGLLRELPKVVPLGGTLPAGDGNANEAPAFAAPSGFTVDADRSALHGKALAYQRQHPGTSYLDAVRAVDPSA
ncbi:hypothetical protein J2X65_002029 [Ancylobacter sp. 3268]|uniref:hypothetical protein n=1 Tax=Ancylobacter sp. 3268 TaxID=2817752 RepID=UPI0028660963|nr:hypothetical protein [Ancylobacter sp. 3268]MDR6952670.1 hypothetical protein [Ancylobacter sp. 3268]